MTAEGDTTSVEADVARAEVRRSGEWWSAGEHEQLVWCLRAGQSIEDIALLLGRGVPGVTARCRMMLPVELRNKRGLDDPERRLRELLAADADYDWEEGFREDARRRGNFYWDSRADNALRDGWEKARPMLALAADTGASERDIVRRLRGLRLAESRKQIAERVGCDPHGALAMWLVMAEDVSAAAVWILDVTGLQQRRYDPHHLSIHASRDDAKQELDRLLEAHRDKGGDPSDVQATIVARTVGEGDLDADAV